MTYIGIIIWLVVCNGGFCPSPSLDHDLYCIIIWLVVSDGDFCLSPLPILVVLPLLVETQSSMPLHLIRLEN